MNKSRNAIPLGSLPPKLRAQAEAQLGLQAQPVEQPKTPRALQPMKEKRIRQSPKPLMNGLETAFFNYLKSEFPNQSIHPQAFRVRISNGGWYKPDFTVIHPDGSVSMWETKGPKSFRGGFEYLKSAATLYPNISFTLAWKDQGQWMFQKVLP